MAACSPRARGQLEILNSVCSLHWLGCFTSHVRRCIVSISGIASSTSAYPKGAHPWFPQLRKDLAAVEASMASGDLAGAQKAFATLTKHRQNVGQAQNGPQTVASTQLSTDLAAVGDALQSGDLAEARKAL